MWTRRNRAKWGEEERTHRQKLIVELIELTLVALLLGACGAPATTPMPHGLESGLLATFDVLGERFHVWVTNPQTIQQILDLQQEESMANIPNGRIRRGPGQGAHHAPWNWHLDPEEIEMAEVTMELCDGTPSFVEEELDYFVETVQRFCPWHAKLVDVRDYR